MKQFVNNFSVTGFVGADAQVRNFDTASVARFSIAVRHGNKAVEGTKPTYTGAFIHAEVWRRNSNLKTFDLLKKGNLITIEGMFKPETWTDEETGKTNSRITLVATKIYATPDKAEEPAPAEPAKPAQKKAKTSRKKKA